MSIERAAKVNIRGNMKRALAVRAANKKGLEEHENALKKQQEALADMWNDWHDCSRKSRSMREVADTLESYRATADGDLTVAFRFLRKAFSDERITDALEWFGLEAPTGFLVRNGRIEEVAEFYEAPARAEP